MRDVIRGHIGYDGLVMSDDLSMNALSGSLAERTRAAFAAGCDMVLHCNGRLDEMEAVASDSPELAGEAGRRAAAALARIRARARAVECCGRACPLRGRACSRRLTGESSSGKRISWA